MSGIKSTTAPTLHNRQLPRENSTSTSLDASLEFQLDDWDDIDDFETPVKGKNDSFNSEISGNSTKPVLPPNGGKNEFTTKLNLNDSVMTPDLGSSSSKKDGLSRSEQSCLETKELEHSVDKTADSPGLSFYQDPEELFPDEIKMPRRRHRAHLKSVMSDSEDDNNVVSKPLKEGKGKMLFVAAFVFYFHNWENRQKFIGEFSKDESYLMFVWIFSFLDDKKTLVDPSVIELDDKSEPDDDKDYIPPSPIPYTSTILEIRSVSFNLPCFNIHRSQRVHMFEQWFISNRSKTADDESRDSQVYSKRPVTALHKPSDLHSKDKTSGCYSFLAFYSCTEDCVLLSFSLLILFFLAMS